MIGLNYWPQRLFESDSGGGSGNQTQTTTSQPYGPAKPMINQSLKDAQKLYEGGGLYINPYQGQMVAGSAPATQQGWGAIQERATQGSPLNQASSQYVQSVLDPGFLQQTSPGLGRVMDNAQNRANAQISLAGRQGSGSHSAAIAGAVAPLEYQDYSNKMALQAQMAQFAPQLAQQDYFDANQLLGVGQQQQAQLQDQINAEMERYYATQGAKANELGLYQSLISGNYGGTTSTTGPVQKSGGTNPWLTGIGALAQFGGAYLGAS